jgi:hypothetical protein
MVPSDFRSSKDFDTIDSNIGTLMNKYFVKSQVLNPPQLAKATFNHSHAHATFNQSQTLLPVLEEKRSSMNKSNYDVYADKMIARQT